MISVEGSVFIIHILMGLAMVLMCSAAEINSLTPLPRLYTSEKYACGNEYDTPFPIYWHVLEDHCIEFWDID